MTSPSVDADPQPGDAGYYDWHDAVARHHNDDGPSAPHHAASSVSVDDSSLVIASGAADVQAALDALDPAVDNRVQTAAVQSYTPQLTAVNTNPNLGSDPIQFGRYVIQGAIAIVHGAIEFGTGSSPGDGAYNVDLPIDMHPDLGTASSNNQPIGTGYAQDQSDVDRMTVSVFRGPADGLVRFSVTNVGQAFIFTVNNNTPWTWDDDDNLEFTCSYIHANA